jgi:hypothetical protein
VDYQPARLRTSGAGDAPDLENLVTLRWQEVAVPLVLIVLLLIGKHVPATAHLSLGHLAGIVSFSYAIFLSLRLVQGEEAVSTGEWSELRASPVELFGAFTAGSFSALLLSVVVFMNRGDANPLHIMAAFGLAVAFALCAAGIFFTSLMVKIRWNRKHIEHRSGTGKCTTIAWSDVVGVDSTWRGISIWGADRQRISFSPYQSGAAALAKAAADRARRNAINAARVPA